MNIPFKTEEEFNEFYNKKVEVGSWISNMMDEVSDWWGGEYFIYQWRAKDGEISIGYKTRKDCAFIDNGSFDFPVECLWSDGWANIYKAAKKEAEEEAKKRFKATDKKNKAKAKKKEIQELKRLVARFPKEAEAFIDGP